MLFWHHSKWKHLDEVCCDLTLTSGWGSNLEINIPQKARISNPFRTPDQPNDILFRRIYSDWRLQGTLTWTCCGTKIYVQVLLHGVWREWLGPAMGMKSTDGSPPWMTWIVWTLSAIIQFFLGGGNSSIFIFIPTWGDDPIWQIFFKWVETTN